MKRLVSFLVSVVLLVAIYLKIDIRELFEVLQKSSPFWMTVSLAMVVPLNVVAAWRLKILAPSVTGMSHWEANKLMLASGTLNMILPSKMGDLIKALFMSERGKMTRSLALACVVFEKGCDILSLLLWCLVGLVFYPSKDGLFWIITVAVATSLLLGSLILGSDHLAKSVFHLLAQIAPAKIGKKFLDLSSSWAEMHNYFWQCKRRLTLVVVISVGLWFLHLLQIWLFVIALGQRAPLMVSFALAPLAILAGLLPLTFAGVGTRDAALIYFYAPYMPHAAAAALGLLCTARYLLPAIGGLPFMSGYLEKVRSYKKQ